MEPKNELHSELLCTGEDIPKRSLFTSAGVETDTSNVSDIAQPLAATKIILPDHLVLIAGLVGEISHISQPLAATESIKDHFEVINSGIGETEKGFLFNPITVEDDKAMMVSEISQPPAATESIKHHLEILNSVGTGEAKKGSLLNPLTVDDDNAMIVEISQPPAATKSFKDHFEVLNSDACEDLPQKNIFTAIRSDKAIVSNILQSLAATENIDDHLEVLNNGTAYELKNLEQCSTEYNRITSSFKATLNLRIDSWMVQRIDQVICPFLYSAFLLKEQKSRIKPIHSLCFGSDTTIQIQSLYHGTNPDNIPSICQSNFNWRLRGTSRGHKFGQGVSFAKRSTYACHYPNTCRDPTRTLILAKVIVGRTMVGSINMIVPQEGFDSTQSLPPNYDVIVKYDDAEYFPEFVIYYNKSTDNF